MPWASVPADCFALPDRPAPDPPCVDAPALATRMVRACPLSSKNTAPRPPPRPARSPAWRLPASSRVDLNGDLLAIAHAVEECRGGDRIDIAVAGGDARRNP
jgi:hypothetical protein